MELTFDIRGNLVPYEGTKLSMDDFEEIFVHSFGADSTKKEIFQNYQGFIRDFKEQVTPNFVHWVDGSFVTKKKNPKDIDFVTLIDFKDYEVNRALIDNRFSKFKVKEWKEFYGIGVDSYTLEIYPENHENHRIYKLDLVYWINQFTKTKPTKRENKKFPKGYVEIKFNSIDDDYSIPTE